MRFVSGLEQVTRPLMARVEPQDVTGQKPLHHHSQRNSADPNGEMEMISHQTVSDDFSARLFLDAF